MDKHIIQPVLCKTVTTAKLNRQQKRNHLIINIKMWL